MEQNVFSIQKYSYKYDLIWGLPYLEQLDGKRVTQAEIQLSREFQEKIKEKEQNRNDGKGYSSVNRPTTAPYQKEKEKSGGGLKAKICQMGSTHSGGFGFRKNQFNSNINKNTNINDSNKVAIDSNKGGVDDLQNEVISEKVEILYEFKQQIVELKEKNEKQQTKIEAQQKHIEQLIEQNNGNSLKVKELMYLEKDNSFLLEKIKELEEQNRVLKESKGFEKQKEMEERINQLIMENLELQKEKPNDIGVEADQQVQMEGKQIEKGDKQLTKQQQQQQKEEKNVPLIQSNAIRMATQLRKLQDEQQMLQLNQLKIKSIIRQKSIDVNKHRFNNNQRQLIPIKKKESHQNNQQQNNQQQEQQDQKKIKKVEQQQQQQQQDQSEGSVDEELELLLKKNAELLQEMRVDIKDIITNN